MKNLNLLHTSLLGVALSMASLDAALALDPWETTYIGANPNSYIARFATDTGGTVVASQLFLEQN